MFKLRSEWKIRETRAREDEYWEEGERDSGTTDKQEGRNRHVAVLRLTTHNARKRIERSIKRVGEA